MWADIRSVPDTVSIRSSGMRDGTAGGLTAGGEGGTAELSLPVLSPGKVVLNNELQSLVCAPRGMESCWKSLCV